MKEGAPRPPSELVVAPPRGAAFDFFFLPALGEVIQVGGMENHGKRRRGSTDFVHVVVRLPPPRFAAGAARFTHVLLRLPSSPLPLLHFNC